MTQLFSNNATTTVGTDLLIGDTVLVVSVGTGGLFPATPGPNDFFMLALQNTLGQLEYCQCTSRSGDNLTIVRAVEVTDGTPAIEYDFLAGSVVECRVTAGTMDTFMQVAAPVISNDLELAGNGVINGETVNVAVRGASGDTSNELVVPAAGGAPTIGGAVIITAGMTTLVPSGAILMWSPLAGGIPVGWVICDGTNSTPDLRDRFIIGQGTPPFDTPGATGGNNTSTGLGGAITTTVDPTTLTDAQSGLPSHSHKMFTDEATSNTQLRGFPENNVSANASYGNNQNMTNGRSTLPVDHGNTEVIAGVSASASHAHGLSLPDHVHTNLPAYMVLAYIMKT